VGKEDPISFLKDAFPCKLHGIKIVPASEAEIKSIILSLKSKNSSGYDEMSKIIKHVHLLIVDHYAIFTIIHCTQELSAIILKFQQ
jgi:hypothetical protein